LGYVLCHSINNVLTLPSGGIIIKLVKNYAAKESKQLYSSILAHIERIAKPNHCTSISIKDVLYNDALSTLGQELFNNRFQSRLTFEMCIDYKNFIPETFQSNIRGSYRSLVNWGKKNLEISIVNKDNLCSDSFAEFKNFHYTISGRKTRSDKTWEIQHKMIEAGFGELILGRYNNKLVAGSLFVDYGDMTIYFIGVYERKLFEFGLSHFLLYNGICRSYERKNTNYFSFGHFDTDIKDNKLYNIKFFQKGFCKNLKPTIFWSKEY
jgi:hypothetical protein